MSQDQYNVFNTVLQNTFSLDLTDLCILRTCAKFLKPLCDVNITTIKTSYNPCHLSRGQEVQRIPIQKAKKHKKTCTVCDQDAHVYDAFSQNPVCDLHETSCITLTDAKKTYKLCDDDLNPLNYRLKYMQAYRIYCTLYSLKDIKRVVTLRYGSINNVPKSKPRTGATKSKREDRIEELLDVYIPSEYHDIFKEIDVREEFLANGKGGITRIKQMLVKWSNHAASLSNSGILNNTIDKQTMVDDFVSFCDIVNYNHGVIRAKLEQISRKSTLEAALSRHNLALRDDSEFCKAYIMGHVDNLQMVVDTMMAMNFFYSQTNYNTIYTTLCNEAYDDAREIIRYAYGYIRNHDEYIELLNDHVDKHQLSLRAKRQALSSYKNDIPDFVNRNMELFHDS